MIYFQHFSDKIFKFWSKTADFTKFWQIEKKTKKQNKKQIGKNGSVGPVKQGFLFSSPYHGQYHCPKRLEGPYYDLNSTCTVVEEQSTSLYDMNQR